MQIFALDEKILVSAYAAYKGKNYLCPECGSIVRLRSGPQRLSHFYHLASSSCRQSQKGLIHLRLQRYLHYLFEEEAEMEKPFPSIRRIADIACLNSKKVYEVQYSPISLEEAKARCWDYESLGLTVIWILHEDHFQGRKSTPAEQFLQTKICYYTNMDQEGHGMIYDQIEGFGKRPVNLRKCRVLTSRKWQDPLQLRAQTWSCFHEGDFLDLALEGKFPFPKRPKKFFTKAKDAYLALLHVLLARSCK